MNIKSETTYSLTQSDIAMAIAEFMAKKIGRPVAAKDVNFKIDGGYVGYTQFDGGRDPSVEASVTLSNDPPAEKPFHPRGRGEYVE